MDMEMAMPMADDDGDGNGVDNEVRQKDVAFLQDIAIITGSSDPSMPDDYQVKAPAMALALALALSL
ncbi:GL18650 [Drosophila persimilis]|uniref:GL18650 n=1 Tax=Drosophila persimilis TaxID=7234 RepID=B4G9G9_DROPE|nr:GL18650 [Drosophila persimilis]